MKVRAGFVSNSSSSSFIIWFDPQKLTKCEHCGHQPQSPIEVINNSYEDSTNVLWEDVDFYLQEIKNNLERSQDELVKLENLDPKTPINRYWTAGNKAYYLQSEIKIIKETIRKLVEAKNRGGTICKIECDHHGAAIRIIRDLISTGAIEVLESDD